MKKLLLLTAILVGGCDVIDGLTGGTTNIDIDNTLINDNENGGSPTPTPPPTTGATGPIGNGFTLACTPSATGSSATCTATGGTPPLKLFVDGREIPGAFEGEGRTSKSLNNADGVAAGQHTAQAQDAALLFSTPATFTLSQ